MLTSSSALRYSRHQPKARHLMNEPKSCVSRTRPTQAEHMSQRCICVCSTQLVLMHAYARLQRYKLRSPGRTRALDTTDTRRTLPHLREIYHIFSLTGTNEASPTEQICQAVGAKNNSAAETIKKMHVPRVQKLLFFRQKLVGVLL